LESSTNLFPRKSEPMTVYTSTPCHPLLEVNMRLVSCQHATSPYASLSVAAGVFRAWRVSSEPSSSTAENARGQLLSPRGVRNRKWGRIQGLGEVNKKRGQAQYIADEGKGVKSNRISCPRKQEKGVEPNVLPPKQTRKGVEHSVFPGKQEKGPGILYCLFEASNNNQAPMKLDLTLGLPWPLQQHPHHTSDCSLPGNGSQSDHSCRK
jgi:hypothetical protein